MPAMGDKKVAGACAAVICCSTLAWIFLMVANVLPDWSNGKTQITADGTLSFERKIGLWAYCLKLFSGSDYECGSISSNLCNNGWLASARAFTILGICFLCFSCPAAAVAIGVPEKAAMAGACLLCTATLSFVWCMLSWGMWIGVAEDCWIASGVAPNYGSSFWLAVTASIFAFLAMLAACAVLAFGKKGGGKKKGVDGIADTPGNEGLHNDGAFGDYPKGEPMVPTDSGDMAPASTPNVSLYPDNNA
jgi:hypothetical protein|mmetsp:Transcript_47702/g.77563  ORF Transcript_47702/g.77563 Transcript_47702/m.77563 type:complete len:248 (+) Transcript_47702:31-774(+)